MALPGYGTVTHPLIRKEFGVPVLSQALLEVLQKQNKTEGKPHPHGTSLPTAGESKGRRRKRGASSFAALPAHAVIWPTCRSDLHVLITEGRPRCGRRGVVTM